MFSLYQQQKVMLDSQTHLRFRPVSAHHFPKRKNRQKNPSSGILTVSIVAGVRLELTTFGL